MIKRIQLKQGVLIFLCAFAILGTCSTTISYFTAQDEKTNRFTTGNPTVEIHETDWDPKEGDGVDMFPGYTVYKNPTVKNTSLPSQEEETVYMRVRVRIKNSKDKMITDPAALELIRSTIRFDKTYTGSFSEKGEAKVLIQKRIPGYTMKEIEKLPMVNPLFLYDEKRSADNELVFQYMGKERDGIFHCQEEATLFTTIAIPIEWTMEDIKQVGSFCLEIIQESIQTKGFSSREDAFRYLDGGK